MGGRVKNKILTLVISSILLVTATVVSVPMVKACDCGSGKTKSNLKSPSWNELIASGAIYRMPGGDGKTNLAVAYNEINGISLYDLAQETEMQNGGAWACFLLCMETSLGHELTETCITACSLCIGCPGPQNPACWAAAWVCAADLGVIIGCYIACYIVCFLANTKITMADGSLKNIENISIGDKVLSYDITNRTTTYATVTKVYHHTPEEMGDYYLIINNNLMITPNHPLFKDDYSLVYAGELKSGDNLRELTGSNSVTSVVKVYEKVFTYNLVVEPHGTYYANGYLTPLKPALITQSEEMIEGQNIQT
jgi:hypothetical protein